MDEFRKTKQIASPLAVTAFLAAGLAMNRAQQNAAPVKDSPVGDWRGMSVCQVKPSGCHDEDSLYHFKTGAKPGTFELQADKIVDGKPVRMGTGPCTSDSGGQLACPIAAKGAVLAFTVTGNEMRGAMTLQDGTLWRKLSLKRVDAGK